MVKSFVKIFVSLLLFCITINVYSQEKKATVRLLSEDLTPYPFITVFYLCDGIKVDSVKEWGWMTNMIGMSDINGDIRLNEPPGNHQNGHFVICSPGIKTVILPADSLSNKYDTIIVETITEKIDINITIGNDSLVIDILNTVNRYKQYDFFYDIWPIQYEDGSHGDPWAYALPCKVDSINLVNFESDLRNLFSDHDVIQQDIDTVIIVNLKVKFSGKIVNIGDQEDFLANDLANNKHLASYLRQLLILGHYHLNIAFHIFDTDD